MKPKVEKLSDLHQQLEAKFAEKGSLLLTKVNEKKFSKLAKEYLEWLASRKSQLGSSGRQQDISKADVIKSLLDEIQVLTLWLFFLLAFCWNKISLIWLESKSTMTPHRSRSTNCSLPFLKVTPLQVI